jgi:hypothetical protein
LDNWLENKPLGSTYPILYELCANQKVSVLEVASEDWVIHFKRRLQGIVREQWYDLAVKLNNIVLNDEKDVPLCRWTASKKFTVKSVYDHELEMIMVYHIKESGKPKFLKKLRSLCGS